MSTIKDAFEAKYLRSAEDPASAEMLAIWEAAWQEATERAATLCDEQGDFYMQQAREGDQSGASDHKACAAVECADAIRSSDE